MRRKSGKIDASENPVKMVGDTGFEPVTSSVWGKRSPLYDMFCEHLIDFIVSKNRL